MWKYVSRRVKDTLERTCNVLDVGRTSFCSSSGLCPERTSAPDAPGPVVAYAKDGRCVDSFRDPKGRFSGRQKGAEEEQASEKERLDHQANSWISALTWSSAIVCGWYTSQYMCLRRKRLGWTPMDRPQSQCQYASLLLNTTRSLHSGVTSRIVLAAPPSPPPPRRLEDVVSPSVGIEALLQNVNNPVAPEEEAKTAFKLPPRARSKSDGSSSSSIDSVVAEFSMTIGDIEYQFAVQDLQAQNYASAVDHLKLATAHHHPAATFNLGLCYERGLGVEKDLGMAMKCYSVASSLGHAKAIYNLGVFYARGLGGLKRNRKAALECFVSAARLGQEEAQLALDLHRERQEQRERRATKTMMTMDNKHKVAKEVSYTVHAF